LPVGANIACQSIDATIMTAALVEPSLALSP
jgi:hypothetical protein